MTHAHRSHRDDLLGADHETLLEIADVLDLVMACRAGLAPGGDDAPLRSELFRVLDRPTQTTWERVREVEIVPSFLPGLSTPSPLGMTVGDIVYAYGLTDVVCPSRSALLRALRWAVEQRGHAAEDGQTAED